VEVLDAVDATHGTAGLAGVVADGSGTQSDATNPQMDNFDTSFATVAVSPQSLVPATTVAQGTWSLVGAPASAHAGLADDLEATGVDGTTASGVLKLGLANGVGTIPTSLVTLTIDALQTGSGTDADLLIDVVEGGVSVLHTVRTLEPLADVADPGNRWEIELTEPERAKIVNMDDVEVWLQVANGTKTIRITRLRVDVSLTGNHRRGHLHFAALEIPDVAVSPNRAGHIHFAALEIPDLYSDAQWGFHIGVVRAGDRRLEVRGNWVNPGAVIGT
jgi:hypothetical protein